MAKPQGLLSPLERQTYESFGIAPRDDRLSMLPRYSQQYGLIAPQFIYDAAKALAAPYTAAQGYDLPPEEAVNVGMNVMGGSFVGSAPKGALRSGFSGNTKNVKPTKEIIGINAGSKEIDNLFNKIANKAENLKLPIEYGASNVSGSRYLTFKNPEGIDYQIRVSNHGDMYPNQLAGTGERFSIDPRSGNSYQDAINWLNEKGINLNKRTKKEKEKTFEEKYGQFSEEELLKMREWAAKNR